VAIAIELEKLAEDGDAGELEALLAEFNRVLQANVDATTFRFLHQSMSPAELVDDLLARRTRLPAVSRPIAVTADTLADFLAARPPGHYQHEAGYDEAQRDITAITAISVVPRDIIGDLLESEHTAAERAAFLLDYRPPASIEDVWVTAQALGAQLAGTPSVRAAVATALLQVELAAHPDEQLAMLLQLALRKDIRLRAYAKKLGL
jgi:hypothetical protein